MNTLHLIYEQKQALLGSYHQHKIYFRKKKIVVLTHSLIVNLQAQTDPYVHTILVTSTEVLIDEVKSH